MIFKLQKPDNKKAPLLLSSPHSGQSFPEEFCQKSGNFKIHNKFLNCPVDTDWFVDRLYDFAPSLGVTFISANYSRFVIDLNRDPQGRLYNDGRFETSLVPLKTFGGEDIYEREPDRKEIQRRLDEYYWPYYKAIEKELAELKEEFGQVLFFDAHSIKHYVPRIREKIFPDLILGSNDEKSAGSEMIQSALDTLESGPFGVAHNDPFKGGHLTRFFGKPDQGIHALQLEMCQYLYMDEKKSEYIPENASQVRALLKKLFEGLMNG